MRRRVSDLMCIRSVSQLSFTSRSPEIILGLPFSEAIDVWSLGVVTAYMISRSLLFEGKDEYETVRDLQKSDSLLFLRGLRLHCKPCDFSLRG